MSQDNTQKADDRGGFILYLSRQSLPIRLLAFIVFILLVVGLIVGITTGLYYFNVTNFPRVDPFAISEDVAVAEFAIFDEQETEAYPAALTTHTDGTTYTGSYANGTIWQIDSAGNLTEIPGTRDAIGSVIGLDVAPDGTLIILDHLDPLITGGAALWQLTPDGTLTELAAFPLTSEDDTQATVSKPNDVAVANDGTIFVADISLGRILRVNTMQPDAATTIWWNAPDESYQIAGLAYDATTDSLLISDAARNAIYRIPVTATDTMTALETIYTDERTQSPPQFNGIDIAPDGTLYAAAFGLNEVWQIDTTTNSFTILTSGYRGGSDVAYDPTTDRIYVNNWDQSWLLPVQFAFFSFDVEPRLPFSIDLIDLNPPADTESTDE